MNVLGICAGIGGLELGLQIAEPGAHPVCFIEADEFCQRILAKHWPDVPIWSDLLTFDPDPWAGYIDAVTAGFPCQPWSYAGDQLGSEDERHLFPAIAEIIRVVGPEFVFLENVPGLVTGGGLPLVLGLLAEMGFAAEWGEFPVGTLGASHLRRRFVLVARSLANAKSLQRRQGRPAQAERSRRPLRSKQGVADASRLLERWQQVSGSQCPVSAQPGKYQPALADAAGDGRDRLSKLCGRDLAPHRAGKAILAHSHSHSHRLQVWEARQAPGEFTPAARGGRKLADLNSLGRDIQWELRERVNKAGRRRLWAPGPDYDWASIPTVFWPAQQCFRGMANGVPLRLDRLDRRGFPREPDRKPRLRALGNSFSPPASAVGWTVLSDRLRFKQQ